MVRRSGLPIFLLLTLFLLLAVFSAFYYTQQTAFAGDEFIDVFPERQILSQQCKDVDYGELCTAKNLEWRKETRQVGDINPGASIYSLFGFKRNTEMVGASADPALYDEQGSALYAYDLRSNRVGKAITITHDFRGQRVRVEGTTHAGDVGAPAVYIGSQKACDFPSVGLNLGGILDDTPKNFLLEIEPSELNSSQMKTVCNGKSLGNTNLADNESVTLGFSTARNGELFLRRIAYLPLFSCKLANNEKLGIESFQGGQLIDKFSGRYEMKRFCLQHPIVRTNSKAQGSDQIIEPLILLNQGKKIQIPQDETWTILYVFDGKNVQTKCDFEKEAIDQNLKCEPINGVVQLGCIGGFIDEQRNICVTTPPQNEKACPIGASLERTENGTIRCVTYLPVDQICSPLTLKKVGASSTCEPKDFLK